MLAIITYFGRVLYEPHKQHDRILLFSDAQLKNKWGGNEPEGEIGFQLYVQAANEAYAQYALPHCQCRFRDIL